MLKSQKKVFSEFFSVNQNNSSFRKAKESLTILLQIQAKTSKQAVIFLRT